MFTNIKMSLRKKAQAIRAVIDDSTQVLSQINVVLSQVDDAKKDLKQIKIAVYITAGILSVVAVTALVFLIVKKRNCT